MHFATATLLAFVSAALAQTSGFDAISTPTEAQNVPAGSTFDIKWDYNSEWPGTVSLFLLGGSSPSTLDILSTLSSGVDNTKGTYSWAVDKSLGSLATYGIKISLDSNSSVFQYSFPFHITGGSTSSSISGSSSATATGSSSSASGSSTASSTSGGSSATITSLASTTTSVYLVSTSSIPGNLSTTASPGGSGGSQTTVTTITTPGSTSTGTASKTSSSVSTVPTSGATSASAGSFAALTGLILAIFAL